MTVDGKTIIGVVENIQMEHENQMKQPVFYSRFDAIRLVRGTFYVKAIAGKSKEVQQYIVQIQEEFYPDFSRNYDNFHTSINMNVLGTDPPGHMLPVRLWAQWRECCGIKIRQIHL